MGTEMIESWSSSGGGAQLERALETLGVRRRQPLTSPRNSLRSPDGRLSCMLNVTSRILMLHTRAVASAPAPASNRKRNAPRPLPILQILANLLLVDPGRLRPTARQAPGKRTARGRRRRRATRDFLGAVPDGLDPFHEGRGMFVVVWRRGPRAFRRSFTPRRSARALSTGEGSARFPGFCGRSGGRRGIWRK